MQALDSCFQSNGQKAIIRVEENDKFSTTLQEPCVASCGQSLILLVNVPKR